MLEERQHRVIDGRTKVDLTIVELDIPFSNILSFMFKLFFASLIAGFIPLLILLIVLS